MDIEAIRNKVEDAVGAILAAARQEYEGPSIHWERESRRAFEDSCDDETLWAAWVDEWIHAAYEQAGERLLAADFAAVTDWCTCGHSKAEHVFHCSHALSCGCEKFSRSRSAKRPKVRVLTPDRWRENRLAGPELNPLAEVI